MAASSDLPGLDDQGLWDLKRYYDARLPEDVRLVPIPQKLASDAAQTWLVQNLQVPELLNISNRTNFADQLSIGAIPWRKAFWKRIVRQIEDEISSESDGYNELNADIIVYLSELIAIPLSNATGTALRRYHYQQDGQRKVIDMVEDEASISGGTTGLRTWPAALLLANYLIGNTSIVSSRSVLELGSGAGLVAALVSQMQASSTGSLIATDFHHSVVERLRGNIARNVRKLECPSAVHSTATEVKRLDWSQPQSLGPTQPIELIIASDVVYDPDLAVDLTSCLAYILEQNSESVVVLSQTIRNEKTMAKFLAACAAQKLEVTEIRYFPCDIASCIVTGASMGENIKLYCISPEARSLPHWAVMTT